MSVSLDDIWSEPLAKSPSPPRRSPADAGDDNDDEDDIYRPAKRRRSSLFLDDPDDNNNDTQHFEARQSSTIPEKVSQPEIDALFDDLEEPTATASKPFDLAAVRREALLRAEKEAPPSSFTGRAVQSSSPPRDGFNPETGSKSGLGGRGEKEKRQVVRLDETRLLGKDGLPALVKLTKEFKPKGKGHELSDLNRLFSTYQFWAHGMYPKTQFSDTVNRVEKLCHQKRMQVNLSVWKDEVNGTLHGVKVGEGDDVDMQSDNADESGNNGTRRHDVFGPPRTSTSPSRAATSSRASSELFELPASRPPSSASEPDIPMDDADPFDIDAFLAEEEEMTRPLPRTATHSITAIKTKGGTASRNFTTYDDDESEMWAEMHGDPFTTDDVPLPVHVGPSASTSATVTRPGPSASRISSAVEDDDVWDILDDLEKESQAQPKSATVQEHVNTTAGQPSESSTGRGAKPSSNTLSAESGDLAAPPFVQSNAGQNLIGSAPNDEDWDDMYVED